jgi:hypothetical protein
MSTTRQDWRSYLATYHDDRPVITERLLSRSMSSPYQWWWSHAVCKGIS